jgi:REP element-mobilizing transposase RayT
MIRNPNTIAIFRRRLPHWEVTNGHYFVTMTLEGAISQPRMEWVFQTSQRFDRSEPGRWHALQRTIFRNIENWLHANKEANYLTHPDVADMIMEAIHHRQQRGDWTMLEYVLMPNHFHSFFTLGEGRRLEPVLDNFKRWTGRQANKILDRHYLKFWHREWFDRWSRSDEEDERIRWYIQNNPLKARLVESTHDWAYGSWNDPWLKSLRK